MVSELHEAEIYAVDLQIKASLMAFRSDKLVIYSKLLEIHFKEPTTTISSSTSANDPKPGSVSCPLVSGILKFKNSSLFTIALAIGCDAVLSTAAAS